VLQNVVNILHDQYTPCFYNVKYILQKDIK